MPLTRWLSDLSSHVERSGLPHPRLRVQGGWILVVCDCRPIAAVALGGPLPDAALLRSMCGLGEPEGF